MEHLGRECEFDALGRKWKAARQTRRVLIEFADWARPMIPNPVKSALEDIDAIVLKDAEILRQLTAADQVEREKAKAEGRDPVLIRPEWQPLSGDIIKQARERKDSWKDINSPEILSILNSFRGQAYLFFLLLKRNHPDITEAMVDEMLEELPGKEIVRILETTSGSGKKAPPKNAEAPAA